MYFHTAVPRRGTEKEEEAAKEQGKVRLWLVLVYLSSQKEHLMFRNIFSVRYFLPHLSHLGFLVGIFPILDVKS